jgi:hypothetical protein
VRIAFNDTAFFGPPRQLFLARSAAKNRARTSGVNFATVVGDCVSGEPGRERGAVPAVLPDRVRAAAVGFELEKERLECGLDVHGHMQPCDARRTKAHSRVGERMQEAVQRPGAGGQFSVGSGGRMRACAKPSTALRWNLLSGNGPARLDEDAPAARGLAQPMRDEPEPHQKRTYQNTLLQARQADIGGHGEQGGQHDDSDQEA